MASIQAFLTSEVELYREIKRRNDVSELARAHDFMAARRIQAWFRGLLTRNHLRMLNKSATIIQRHWRGFIARKLAKARVKDQVTKMWREYYDRCATRVQALWRGYRSRKHGVDLPKYRQWLRAVSDKNDQAVAKMKELRNSEATYMRETMEQESMLWILFILFKLHHLLRTKCQPGVLTRIDKTRFTAIEKMIKCLEYTLYMEKRHRDNCNQHPPEQERLLLEGTCFARCEKEIRSFERSIELGKACIRRGTTYGEKENFLKRIEDLRAQLMSRKLGAIPFRTVTKCRMPCDRGDSAIRVMIGDYSPPKTGFTTIRAPRDKSKELHGNFKVVVKPNELYEAINEIDCPFGKLDMKCPVHDVS